MKRIVHLRNGSLAAIGCILLAIAFLATGVVKEAEGNESPSEVPAIVVDGNHWMSASEGQQRAFLIGVANMIVAEIAYAKYHGFETPPVSKRIADAVADLSLPDIERRITHWYETHPQEKSMPAMVVIWKDIVGKESK